MSIYEAMVPAGIDPDGRLDQPSMDYDQTWYVKRGHLRERIDLTRVIDTAPRDAAIQRIGRYTPRP